MLKQQKGVTLVALVITIIVLLILAGVSIAMLTGENGILTKATDSKTKTIAAELREQVSLTIGEIIADQEKTNITSTSTNGIADEIATRMTKNGYTTTATSTTSLTVTRDSKTYTITINDKYAVTEIKDGETSIYKADTTTETENS